MRRIATLLLTMVLVFHGCVIKTNSVQATERKQFIVEENYFSSDIYIIVHADNGYDKVSIFGSERYKQAVQSAKEVLRLPLVLDTHEINDGFLMPSGFSGIEMDIPYNYYSSLESSARYFHMLLRNGWEIEYYNASSLCVQIGLVNSLGITCRLLIYEDYLKVYCSLM